MKLITTLILAAACLATAQVKKPIPLTVDATTGVIIGAPGAALFGSANSLGGGGGGSANALDPGTAALPSVAFATDPNTGIYRVGADQLGFSTNGVNRVTISTAGVTLTLPLTLPDGSAAAPSLRFTTTADVGAYYSGGNFGIAADGASVATFSPSYVTVVPPLRLPSSAAQVALGFNGDEDTGLVRIGANILGLYTNNAEVMRVTTTGVQITGTLTITAPLGATYGGFGVSVAAANGVPLFATGTPTFTGTSGTGNFARVDSPAFTTQITVPLVTNGGSTLDLAGGSVTLTAAGSVRATVSSTLLTLGSNIGIAFAGTGAATTKTNLSLNNVENTALSTWTGAGTVVTVGTVTTGTWNATIISSAKGGLGIDASAANGVMVFTTGTPTATATTGAGNVMRTRTGVRRTVYISAGAMIPRQTAGAAPGTFETTTNKIMYDSMDFDTTTEEHASFWLTLPSAWDAGTITCKAHWTAAAGTGTVKWDFAARCFADDDAIDQAYGTEQTTGADTLLAVGDMHIAATTSALTVGGTVAANRPINFTVDRDVAGDTLTADAKLLGVTVEFTESATEPSAQ